MPAVEVPTDNRRGVDNGQGFKIDRASRRLVYVYNINDIDFGYTPFNRAVAF